MLRVLIADDHPVVRAGLRQIMGSAPDIVVSGEAANCPEILDAVRERVPDLVLLDISFPGGDGIEVLKLLRQRYPRLPILMLTIHPETEYAVRALRAGASGYLVKDASPSQMIEAIRQVASGGRYITPSVAEQLAFVLLSSSPHPHRALSDREYRVMCLIASGKSPSEIAAELCLSPKTISTYRSRVLEKMKMHTNAELTHYAFQHGLLEH